MRFRDVKTSCHIVIFLIIQLFFYQSCSVKENELAVPTEENIQENVELKQDPALIVGSLENGLQ